jgi:hypothetical protein
MTTEITQQSGSSTQLCLNCDALLQGHFCAHCGQPHHALDPSLHDLLHEATHEFLHLDGKILTTLKDLIFFPGRLSTEFLAGKRARYIGPIRLYLTMSLLFFLLMGYNSDKAIQHGSGIHAETQINISNKDPKISQWFNRSIAHALEDPKAFLHEMMANTSHIMFVLVPLFALILRFIYFRRTLRYPAYVYFALHLHAFFFLVLAVKLLIGLLKIDWLENAAGWIQFFWMPIYLFMAMRRVFGGTRRRTLLRFAVLNMVYFPCLGVGLLLALCLTIARG